MSLKSLLVTAYGSSLYKETCQLQDALYKVASSKNQMIFIARCKHHGIIPRFLRTLCPIKSRYAKRIVTDYRIKLLICTKKEASWRFHKYRKLSTQLKSSISNQVSTEHFEIISRVTETCREKKFQEVKSKLKRKFELLYEEKNKRTRTIETSCVKKTVS